MLAQGHRLGLKLIRERLRDSQQLHTQVLAVEMLARFWRREAEDRLTAAELAGIDTLADHGADAAWSALLRAAGETVH